MVGRNNSAHRAGVAQTNGYRFLMNTSESNHAEVILVFKYVPKQVRLQAWEVKFHVCLNKIVRRHRRGGDVLTQ